MEFIVNRLENDRKNILISENGKYYLFKESAECPMINLAISHLFEKIPEGIPIYEGEINEDVPVAPEKIFLPAINFRSHSEETRTQAPKKPYFFTKHLNALVGNGGNVLKPKDVKYLDYEGEIAVIIGKKIKSANLKSASEAIFGYTLCNDISARDYQNDFQERLGKNWILGKASDTFLPIGPRILIKSDDEPDFNIKTYINEEKRQDGYLHDMVYSFPALISEVSKFITLVPGDIITSGTPSGVAMGGSGRFLENGDRMHVIAEGIGRLTNTVIDE
ncbi:MAG: fumarylacetoacetate hydrolase family protein [Thermoplasmataceae archaeon]